MKYLCICLSPLWPLAINELFDLLGPEKPHNLITLLVNHWSGARMHVICSWILCRDMKIKKHFLDITHVVCLFLSLYSPICCMVLFAKCISYMFCWAKQIHTSFFSFQLYMYLIIAQHWIMNIWTQQWILRMWQWGCLFPAYIMVCPLNISTTPYR